jgi:parallel beta-helix repeat protein
VGFENLHVLDISDSRAPTFTADRNSNRVPDVLLGSVALPAGPAPHSVAVAGPVAYVVTSIPDPGHVGTFQVVDVAEDARPRLLGGLDLPVPNPTGLAVLGDVVYVGARAAGVLVIDVHEPAAPRLLGTIGNPDPSAPRTVTAGPVAADGFAYLIEQQQEPQTGQVTEHLIVLEVHNPLAPVRRGTVALRGVTRERVTPALTGGSRLAVAGSFVYVARGELGLQVMDISQPDAPRLVGMVATPSLTRGVVTADRVLYVLDIIFGLQALRGPGPDEPDTDGDGILDVFDAFPTDPTEWQDTDGDRVGDNADPDDDNDGFTDAEETAAIPPTDPLDPRRYPVTPPPAAVTTLVVDAASTVPVRERNGTPAAPYRSPTEALQVLRHGQAPQVHTVHLRPGRYAPSTTQDVFPLDLSGLAPFTLQGADRATTVLDAEWRDNVVEVRDSQDLVVEEVTITHGQDGLVVGHSREIVIRRTEVRATNAVGIVLINSTSTVIQENLVEVSGAHGIGVFHGSEAVVTQNVARASGVHGILVYTDARADVRDNVCEGNGFAGIVVDLGSSATITNNLTQDNVMDGIIVIRASGTITDNLTQHNGRQGIRISRNADVTASHNVIQHNASDGIIVFDRSRATLTDNLIQHNGQATPPRDGIRVTQFSSAVLRHNTVTHSGQDGIRVFNTAEATISGGSSTQNSRDGIRVGGARLCPAAPRPPSASTTRRCWSCARTAAPGCGWSPMALARRRASTAATSCSRAMPAATWSAMWSMWRRRAVKVEGRQAHSDANLYELDPVTGAAMPLGPTGVEVVSGVSPQVLR